MKFLDRSEEIKRLGKVLQKDTPSFVVLYGRRRLGKSTLLQKVLTDNDIYFLADRTDQSQQRKLLSQAIASKFDNFDNISFPDWESLLRELCYRAQNKNVFTLCIDEFPYLVRSCPELPSVIQKFIDMKSFPFHLVVCGSSQHLMQDIILNSSQPLYGRAQQIIRLRPLHIRYMSEAFSNDTTDEIVSEYAVWGGVPRYWELREDEDNLMDAVMNQVANAEGLLYEEPDRLLADDMSQTAIASSILSVIGNDANRISEIANRLNRKSTDLSVAIKNLTELGYIEREIPFGENQRNTKRSLYKISDEFLSFYFRFVVPERSLIGLGRYEIVKQYIVSNYADFASKEWERLCRHAVSGNVLFGISWNVASRWWGTVSKGHQLELDLVAESFDKSCILIGECKWTKEENATLLLNDLKNRSKDFPYLKGHKVFYALFLRNTPADGMQPYVFLPNDVINDFE